MSGKPRGATFWECVDKGGDDGCWNWMYPTTTGYGIFWTDGKKVPAHRLSYIIANGAIPDGMQVCHKCDNPSCVNPDHLFLGTFRDNMMDKNRKGRHGYTGSRGESHPMHKLSKSDVAKILDMKGKLSQRKIANQFNVSQATIYRILSGKGWVDRKEVVSFKYKRDDGKNITHNAPGKPFGSDVEECIDKYSSESGCWTWMYSTRNGYGVSQYNGRVQYVHRIMYERYVGEIQAGMFVCHKCDNPICCNPAHLYLGSSENNMRDVSVRNRNHFKGLPADRNGNAKLSWTEVNEIRRKYKSGSFTMAALSREYKVTGTNIRDIVNFITWKIHSGSGEGSESSSSSSVSGPVCGLSS